MERGIKYINLLFALYLTIFNYLSANEINNQFYNSINYKKDKREVYKQLFNSKLDLDSLVANVPLESEVIYCIQYGKLLFKKGNYNKSIIYFDRALKNLSTDRLKEAKADCAFYLGKIYAQQSNTDSILLFLNSAAKIYEDLDLFSNTCFSYMEIACYFSKKGNKMTADTYFNKATSLLKYVTEPSVIDLVNFNYANHANVFEEYDLALQIYLKLIERTATSSNTARNAMVLNNIGAIYIAKKQWSLAKGYLDESLILRQQINDTLGIKSTLMNLLRIAISTSNDIDATKIVNQLNNECFIDSYTLDEKVLLSFNKIGYYALLGKTDLIGKELGQYNTLKDSLSNIAFSDKLVEMQKSFEIQERDKNIALLQKEDELKETRLNNQFIVIVSISVVVLVLIVLGYFINRQRLKLKKSECELKKQQDRIQAMNDNLDLSNQAKDRILSIIGHDLRGPIGGLKELIDLYVDLPTYEEEDFKSLIKAAREASTGSYHLLENLLTWANSQRGQINFMPVNAPLYPLVKQCVDLLDSSINTRHVGFKFDIHPNLKLTADLNMIRTVVRNLVSNAVKYSPPESCVTISAVQNNVETLISITDSGYGMSADQAEVLFTQKETYYIEAGYNAKGTGLGLILCREFVERHNGRIWADSKTNKGTQVCFTIPRNIKEELSNVPSHKNSAVLN